MGKSIYKDLTVHSLNLAAFSVTSETVKNKNKETNKLGTAVQISTLNVIVVRHKPSDFVGMSPNPCMAFARPSRSIHFGDVSEANGRKTSSLGPRDPTRIGRAE